MEDNICRRTTNYKTTFYYHYDECGRKVKYQISYIDIQTRVEVKQKVCGMHMRAQEKASERMKRFHNFDDKFTAIPI